MERIAAKLRVAIFSALAGRDEVRAQTTCTATASGQRSRLSLCVCAWARQNPLAGLPPSDLAIGLSDAAVMVAQEILQAGTTQPPLSVALFTPPGAVGTDGELSEIMFTAGRGTAKPERNPAVCPETRPPPARPQERPPFGRWSGAGVSRVLLLSCTSACTSIYCQLLFACVALPKNSARARCALLHPRHDGKGGGSSRPVGLPPGSLLCVRSSRRRPRHCAAPCIAVPATAQTLASASTPLRRPLP